MAVAKKFVLKHRPQGLPKVSDFEAVTEDLPPVGDNEILLESVYLSVDPYMRYKSSQIPLGSTMPGQAVAKVVESKHPGYKTGDNVLVAYGWRSHIVGNPDKMVSTFDEGISKPQVLPDFGPVPASVALGVLGVTGISALFGLVDLTEPKAGETLVVTGAAGAVGSTVGQIGKILGLTVIGFAGSDDKVKWLKEELGFDYAYNYKTTKVSTALKESAPKGVDVYFDNVGGEIGFEICQRMNPFGRVSMCGAISSYNDMGNPNKYPMSPAVQLPIIANQLTVRGFIVTRWADKWMSGVSQLLGYVKSGKLKYRETITEGFDNMPKAFIEILNGENTGKAIVKAKM